MDRGDHVARRGFVRLLVLSFAGASLGVARAEGVAARKHRRPKRPIQGLQQHKDNPTHPAHRVGN
jgi:hypothetical protein